jgi:hypothetical protein
MWMIRFMLSAEAVGIDRAQYFRLFEDWPESSTNTNGSQFATMRLLSQPVDSNANLIVRTPAGDYMAQFNEFKDYTYLDSIATGITGVHEYRYTNGTYTMYAIWSEEITTIVNNQATFTERTGTITLPNGSYTLRQFDDKGGSTMSSTAFGGGATNYASKPVFIINTSPTPPTQNKTGIIYF